MPHRRKPPVDPELIENLQDMEGRLAALAGRWGDSLAARDRQALLTILHRVQRILTRLRRERPGPLIG